MPLDLALNAKYDFLKGLALIWIMRWERCGCEAGWGVKWCISDSTAHLHTHTCTHLSPQGLPSLTFLRKPGPSLLTKQITTAERVIRGCEGLRERGVCYLL